MRIASYVPQLTPREAERCWMQPLDLAGLAVVDSSDPQGTRRFLNNISDRGFVPFEKSGTGKTAPRLYSLKSAVMMRALREITYSGRTYEFASPIANKMGDLLVHLVATLHDLFDIAEDDYFIAYSSGFKGEADMVRMLRHSEITPTEVARSVDTGFLCGGYIIWNCCRLYADAWARDRELRGVGLPPDRYSGCDINGRPLDPAHPWNANLPPLERARRLLEIEEYIAKRELTERGSNPTKSDKKT